MIDTSGPYHMAYTVVAIAYAGYALSIWWRVRTVRARRRAMVSSEKNRTAG